MNLNTLNMGGFGGLLGFSGGAGGRFFVCFDLCSHAIAPNKIM